MIADDSGCTIVVGFWGPNCKVVDDAKLGSTIIAIKNAQVSEYAGKSLNSCQNQNSVVIKDPEIDRARDVLLWWCDLDDDAREELKDISKDCPMDSNPGQAADLIEHQKFQMTENADLRPTQPKMPEKRADDDNCILKQELNS